MTTSFKNPVFTSITSLVAAAATNPTTFTLNWSDPGNILYYKLYRHIERKYPSNLANGGIFKDPSNPASPLYTNPPVYKAISDNLRSGVSLYTTLTTYSDSFADMSIHADEGISLGAGGKWRDNNGAGDDVIDQILHTDRRLYYKLIAVTDDVAFNSTPFIYTCLNSGIQCRSVITQVRWNTLYQEGEIVWYNSDVQNCNRTSVDLIYYPATNRYNNVWVGGRNGFVSVLNGTNGQIVRQFATPVGINYVAGIRVDQDTGNGVYVGDKNQVYSCNIISGTQTRVSGTGASYVPNGNNGLVLTNESESKYAYIVANSDVVSKCDYSGNLTSPVYVVPRTELGCTPTTPTPTNVYPLQNVLGITNGPDQGVWVNMHVPIRYKYTYPVVTLTNEWKDFCSGGTPNGSHLAAYNAAHPSGPPATCDASKDSGGGHKELVARITYVTVDTSFLQDIGYIIGVGSTNRYKANIDAILTPPFDAPDGPTEYWAYTTQSNRSGWLGVSPNVITGFPEYTNGMPYTTQTSPVPDPTTLPMPGISQKGMTADIPLAGTSPYNLFQVNQLEDKVHRLYWNGTSLTYPYFGGGSVDVNDDYWSIGDPIHAITDSQNNVWILRETLAQQLTLIYQISANTVFPYGGNSVWPTISALGDYASIEYRYGDNFNDPDMEYALTRYSFSSSLTTVPTDGYRNTFGMVVSGANEGEQRVAAKTWLATGSNWSLSGQKLYPNYVAAGNMYRGSKGFARQGGTNIAVPSEYNSDNTGINFIFTGNESEFLPAYIHPDFEYPDVDLRILPVASTPLNCDETFWDDQKTNNSEYTSASGYDDFTAGLSAVLISQGSFYLYGYDFYLDDKIADVGEIVPNPVVLNTVENYYEYPYHDPSLNGKPFNRTMGGVAESNGMYNPFVVANINDNVYLLSGDTMGLFGSSDTVEAIVWERWPTARFNITPFDTSAIRCTYLTSWRLEHCDYPVGDNGEEVNSERRIVSGYDPLSAQFNDSSITRTWPLSNWYWTFGDKLTYLGFSLTHLNSTFNVPYPHVISAIQYEQFPTSTKDNCTTEHPNMTAHLYKGPGVYYSTLWVRASNTGTDSWTISAGVTDQYQMSSTFVIAATRQINVLEVCPAISFTVSGIPTTLLSSYRDDFDPLSAYKTSAGSAPSSVNSPYGIISGYSPYLEVTFSGYLTSRSLPISAAVWDFGDAYLNHIYSDEVTLYPPPTAGWPVWNPDPYYTTGHHVYVMPGFYNVTLIPITSADQANYVSNCTGFEKHMHVYLKELTPVAGLSADVIQGNTPLTVRFTSAPHTSAGSFPICRIDWDFGDNTPVLTFSRFASSVYANYASNSAYEASDPRNVIVDHEYNRNMITQPNTYTASISVYACNTNTMATTSMSIGPINLEAMSVREGDVHLIENRMSHQNNDLLLVFEGQKSLQTYTVLLSSAST